MTVVGLRPAVPGDLDAVVAVFLRCWRESYAAVLPAEVIGTMDDAAARALWHQAIAGLGEFLVAEGDGRMFGMTRFLCPTPGHGYVASLYVSPEAQGLGVGTTLLAEAESRLASGGARSASLWAFRGNTPSLAFYRARGWATDGGSRVESRFGAEELRLSKTLALTSPAPMPAPLSPARD